MIHGSAQAGMRQPWMLPGGIILMVGVVVWLMVDGAGPLSAGSKISPFAATVDGRPAFIGMESDSPQVIMVFSPDCPHCERQLSLFESHAQDLQGVKLIVLSLGEPSALPDRPLLRSLPSAVLGTIDRGQARERFGRFVVPLLLVIDRRGIVKKRMSGVTEIEQIVSVLGNI